MHRILHPADFTSAPWKNGGGTTHEISREEADGRLLWRLSIAEVAADGPFSHFEGMARILTVIGGEGLQLIFADKRIALTPRVPFAFSGEVAVEGRLTAGPVRDFNLIYDPARLDPSVDLVDGPNDDDAVWLVLDSPVTADGEDVPAGVVVWGRVRLGPGAACLRVTLRRR